MQQTRSDITRSDHSAPATLLVTGARGFIGQYCLAALAQQPDLSIHAVTASIQPVVSPPAGQQQITWHHCNLHDAPATSQLIGEVRPTHLLHLAWIATPGIYWESPENEVWLASSGHLLREFIAAGGQRVVIAGSCAEYDWTDGICHEITTPAVSLTRYADCKHRLRTQAEELCESAEVELAWGRVFFAYGPGEPVNKLIPSVIGGLLAGQQVACTAGQHRRDFIYATDLGEAFSRLLLSSLQGVVNLGSGQASSIADVVRLIEELTGRHGLVQLGARPGGAQEPPLVVADTSRLHTKLGFQPACSLRNGLSRYLDYWTQTVLSGSGTIRRAAG